MTTTDRIIVEREGPIGWITFNNPERRNAMSVDMWEGLAATCKAFDADRSIRVIVMKGAGDKAFVSGADISEFEQQRSSKEGIARYEELVAGVNDAVAKVSKPTIAMIQGWCVGGGLGIALCCDLRFASDDSRFAIPAAKLGLGYRMGGVKKLVDIVGPAFAKEIFFTARKFDVTEALAMGLINRALPRGELEAYVRATCATIAENAPMTIATEKHIIDAFGKPSSEIDEAALDRMVQTCFDSADYTEGRRAFMEKRVPQFRGE